MKAFGGIIKRVAQAVPKAEAKAAASKEGATTASSSPMPASGGRGVIGKLFRSPQFKKALEQAVQKQVSAPAMAEAPAKRRSAIGKGLLAKVAKAAMPAMKMKNGGMADKAGRAMKKTAADARGRAMKKGK